MSRFNIKMQPPIFRRLDPIGRLRRTIWSIPAPGNRFKSTSNGNRLKRSCSTKSRSPWQRRTEPIIGCASQGRAGSTTADSLSKSTILSRRTTGRGESCAASCTKTRRRCSGHLRAAVPTAGIREDAVFKVPDRHYFAVGDNRLNLAGQPRLGVRFRTMLSRARRSGSTGQTIRTPPATRFGAGYALTISNRS